VTARGADAGRLADELQFLLRSLEDLDTEHADGSIPEQRYQRLRAEYTARAAEVARAAEATPAPPAGASVRERPRRRVGHPRGALPRAARRGARRRVVAVVAALTLAGLGGTAAVVAEDSGTGTAGPSGPAAGGDGAVALDQLRRAVQQNPADAAAHDALADGLAASGDLGGALREFEAAATLDPRDVVALSYSGWIAMLGGAVDKALPRLDQAEAADPGYPDAHAFRGIALLRSGGNRAEAVAELRRYQQLAPDGAMRQQVRDVLSQLGETP